MAPDAAIGALTPKKKKKAPAFKHRAIRPPSDSNEGGSPAVLAAPAKEQNGDSLDLFRRSKVFFPRAVEEQEQRLKAETGAKRRKLSPAEDDETQRKRGGAASARSPYRDRKSKSKSVERQGDDESNYGDIYGASDTEMDSKKALVHRSASATETHPVSPPLTHSENGSSLLQSPNPSVDKPKPIDKGKGLAFPHDLDSASMPVSASSAPNPAPDAVITLSDDDGSPRPIAKREARTAGNFETVDLDDSMTAREDNGEPEQAENDDEDEVMEAVDPEFADYILRAQARESAAKAANEAALVTSRLRTPAEGESSATPAPDDPAIKVFVSPRLPEIPELEKPVPPLVVKIRLSQKMKLVKDTAVVHCKKHGFDIPEQVAKGMILTWKGVKIYNWTTGQSLHLTPDATGRFRGPSGQRLDGESEGYSRGGLFVELWTEDSYKEYLQDKAVETKRNIGELPDVDMDGVGKEEEKEEERPQQPADNNIRLVLKSKDLEPVRMTVKPHTTISTLALGFRKTAGIGQNQKVSIFFDGEHLDPESTVGDAEMEDMDSVEVHVQ